MWSYSSAGIRTSSKLCFTKSSSFALFSSVSSTFSALSAGLSTDTFTSDALNSFKDFCNLLSLSGELCLVFTRFFKGDWGPFCFSGVVFAEGIIITSLSLSLFTSSVSSGEMFAEIDKILKVKICLINNLRNFMSFTSMSIKVRVLFRNF